LYTAADKGGVDLVSDRIRTHFDLGGTQINLNVIDRKRTLEAQDPSKDPGLIVRVTGFSAYLAVSLKSFAGCSWIGSLLKKASPMEKRRG